MESKYTAAALVPRTHMYVSYQVRVSNAPTSQHPNPPDESIPYDTIGIDANSHLIVLPSQKCATARNNQERTNASSTRSCEAIVPCTAPPSRGHPLMIYDTYSCRYDACLLNQNSKFKLPGTTLSVNIVVFLISLLISNISLHFRTDRCCCCLLASSPLDTTKNVSCCISRARSRARRPRSVVASAAVPMNAQSMPCGRCATTVRPSTEFSISGKIGCLAHCCHVCGAAIYCSQLTFCNSQEVKAKDGCSLGIGSPATGKVCRQQSSHVGGQVCRACGLHRAFSVAPAASLWERLPGCVKRKYRAARAGCFVSLGRLLSCG